MTAGQSNLQCHMLFSGSCEDPGAEAGSAGPSRGTQVKSCFQKPVTVFRVRLRALVHVLLAACAHVWERGAMPPLSSQVRNLRSLPAPAPPTRTLLLLG